MTIADLAPCPAASRTIEEIVDQFFPVPTEPQVIGLCDSCGDVIYEGARRSWLCDSLVCWADIAGEHGDVEFEEVQP